MQPISRTNRVNRLAMLAGVAFGVCVLSAVFLASTAGANTAVWEPSASEKLVKLPATYLKKAVDRDFAKSELATALTDVKSQIGLKTQTLQDLQSAIDRAEGEVRTELRHQFLAEKQEFIKLMGEQQELQRKQVETKIRLYERLLDKLGRSKAAASPQRAELIKQQEGARQRFETTVAAVDMKLFDSTELTESKYSRDYAKNMSAIESLVLAIQEHPMNQEAELDGQEVTKEDYLRHLIADNQARVAIFDQEETILGYMAKLVALDAMALSEEVAGDNLASDGLAGEGGEISLSSTVDFFITQ